MCKHLLGKVCITQAKFHSCPFLAYANCVGRCGTQFRMEKCTAVRVYYYVARKTCLRLGHVLLSLWRLICVVVFVFVFLSLSVCLLMGFPIFFVGGRGSYQNSDMNWGTRQWMSCCPACRQPMSSLRYYWGASHARTRAHATHVHAQCFPPLVVISFGFYGVPWNIAMADAAAYRRKKQQQTLGSKIWRLWRQTVWI